MIRHNLLFAILSIVVLPCGMVTADEVVAKTQRILKLQGFYFGKIDGSQNEETLAAVKRFQIRSGLPVTGNIDAATWQELAKNVKPEPAADTVESMREIARNQEKDDREFLLRTEAAERAEVNEPPQPRPSTRPPELAVPPSTSRESASVRPSTADIRRYIQRYLDAAEAPSPELELSFYADRVDYFGNGRVSREFVRKDQLKYYDRWPTRRFEMVGEPQIEWLDQQQATVRFKLRYALRNESKQAQGLTESLIYLRKNETGMEIVGMRERKLKE
jgi:hypothetical protein